jgi:hypothetical protein
MVFQHFLFVLPLCPIGTAQSVHTLLHFWSLWPLGSFEAHPTDPRDDLGVREGPKRTLGYPQGSPSCHKHTVFQLCLTCKTNSFSTVVAPLPRCQICIPNPCITYYSCVQFSSWAALKATQKSLSPREGPTSALGEPQAGSSSYHQGPRKGRPRIPKYFQGLTGTLITTATPQPSAGLALWHCGPSNFSVLLCVSSNEWGAGGVGFDARYQL